MTESYLGISIPKELQKYKKNVIIPENNEPEVLRTDFGVKVVKDKDGNPTHAEYYSDNGDLLKKIFYKGSAISTIEHYRNSVLYSQEEYRSGLLYREMTYSCYGDIISNIKYCYNNKDKITSIRKTIKDNVYDVEYGYDDLMRVNSRILKYNNEIIEEQKYRYDILDRIVEYQDRNQIINVHKINQNNDMISYTITDKAGNTISVINKFLCTEYIGTELDLNGHKTTVHDKCYIDNILLKKPTTTKDDLDFAMSGIFRKLQEDQSIMNTKRFSKEDMIEKIIGEKIEQKYKVLPISMRKLQLLCNL